MFFSDFYLWALILFVLIRPSRLNHFHCLSPCWRVNYELIEFEVKYPAAPWYFSVLTWSGRNRAAVHQFQEGFIQLIRLASFFCGNKDQMQKQLGVICNSNCNLLHRTIKVKFTRNLKKFKTEEQIQEVQQKRKKLWHFEQTSGIAARRRKILKYGEEKR